VSRHRRAPHNSLVKSTARAHDRGIGSWGEIMKIVPLIVVASLFLTQSSRAAVPIAPDPFELRCEREMGAQIEVHFGAVAYRVSNTVSSARLGNRSVRNSVSQRMLGMTEIRARSEVSFDAPGLTDAASDRECVAPKISVTLMLPPLDVYVAREFAPNSCAYHQVLNHELRHVQVYREALPALAQKIRGALAERFGSSPLYAARNQGMDKLEHEIDNWLRPMIRAGLQAIEVAQAQIDTDDEDSRISRSCQGEIAHRVAAFP
jgi:hypothetical protein